MQDVLDQINGEGCDPPRQHAIAKVRGQDRGIQRFGNRDQTPAHDNYKNEKKDRNHHEPGAPAPLDSANRSYRPSSAFKVLRSVLWSIGFWKIPARPSSWASRL